MNSDIRVSTAFPDHKKTRRLIAKYGPEAAWSLICLWADVSQNAPTGDISHWSIEDIALAGRWHKDPGVFLQALVPDWVDESLDNATGKIIRKIHDWAAHNPFAATSEERKDRARFNAAKKWVKKFTSQGTPLGVLLHHDNPYIRRVAAQFMGQKGGKKSNATGNACDNACPQIGSGGCSTAKSDAPSPSPSPSPSIRMFDFQERFKKYPNKERQQKAENTFFEIITADNLADLDKALNNYLEHLKINTWRQPMMFYSFIAEFREWLNHIPQATQTDTEREQLKGELRNTNEALRHKRECLDACEPDDPRIDKLQKDIAALEVRQERLERKIQEGVCR